MGFAIGVLIINFLLFAYMFLHIVRVQKPGWRLAALIFLGIAQSNLYAITTLP